MANKIPLIFFIGPTAVGKTRLAIETALLCGDAEIVSADSRLFYRGMNIGTAKPTLADMKGVPHYLMDIAEPDEVISLGLYQKLVQHAVETIGLHDHLPFLVGGTGQYIRAITEGWSIPEVAPEPGLRQFLNRLYESRGMPELQRWLAKLDPVAWAEIDQRNPRRVMRALEVTLRGGRTFSSQRTRQETPYALIQIGLEMPRAELFAAIDARVDQMIGLGLESEVRALLAKGYSTELPSMTAIGYQEMVAYLLGRSTLAETVRLMKRHTHQFVRRQETWFRKTDPNIHWFDARSVTPEEIVEYVYHALKAVNRDAG